MMKTNLQKRSNAFSLVELLMVLTIISIMAALVINAFTNAAKDTADIISRQQQAVLKSALDNAISQYMVGGKTVADARNYYNYSDVAAGTERTTLERLALVETFLDPDTYAHFIENSSDTQVRSSAMVKTSQHVEFEFWTVPSAANRNTYPKVNLSS